jgi:hypothetical protein
MMTDAAMPVTERAVEQFTESYLISLGADIRKDGRRWIVSLPEATDTDLELENTVLQIASDIEEVSEDAIAVTPESAFVEQMVDEAADRTPVGSISLTGENSEIRLPEWITAGPVEVADRAFTPYYDRRALCVLFHVGIETVSEYQREELRAIAIDINDHEERPRLAESYLDLTEVGRQQSFSEGTSVDARTVEEAIASGRTAVVGEVDPTVKETQERATRAAEVELDEYRQFVRQRRNELKDEIDNISERIEEVNEAIDNAPTQDERVDALQKRKELSSEVEDLRAEFNELTDRIETGFPKKREDIRERHSLTVRIRPVTVTTVSYERGDLELTFRMNDTVTTITHACAVGLGVLEAPVCSKCGQKLTGNNPLTLEGESTIGEACCSEGQSPRR